MSHVASLTQEIVRDLFDYKDGSLVRRGSGKKVICSKVGRHRYLRVSIEGKPVSLHRVIYLWHHGYLPEAIDHINGDRFDNRIENLRGATQAENCLNRKHHSNSRSPCKNVYLQAPTKRAGWKRNWVVSLTVNRKRKYIGSFEDLDLAELVAIEAREKFHGQFARHH